VIAHLGQTMKVEPIEEVRTYCDVGVLVFRETYGILEEKIK